MQFLLDRRARVVLRTVRPTTFASLLAASAICMVSLRSTADDTLTLDLPQSPQAKSAIAASTAQAASANTPTPKPAPKPSARRASLATTMGTKKFGSRGGRTVNGTRQFTVGRLGIATQQAPIRAARGSNRTVLSKVAAGTYLALNCENGAWFGVLMADRTTGWVRKNDVKILDYEVVSNRQSDAAAYTANNAPNLVDPALQGGQKTILDSAYQYLGVPYKWGGTSANGLDCSALVQRCFNVVGVHLPRTAREQIAVGMPVSTDQLQAADRLYFANSSGDIVHTGIYIGNGYFIHASSKHRGVAVSNLSEDLYTRMYAGARR